ncbi:hypothetical protein [Pseudofrankia sp. BMG5.36]|uniref:hypothetical protein n=1 Tax=Pseudofrankia sp. BMG5.36 TaxID=1834512 RepID=UPI0008DAB55E|nr:hypothetical protein [Pseudofrankia sp. BMG5.36]
MGAHSWPSRAAGRGARRLAVGAVLAGVLFALAPASPVLPAAGALAAGTPTRSPTAPTAQAPPGTVTRTNEYLTDAQGRVLVVHGPTLPAGATPGDTDLDAWVGAGFSTVGVTVLLTAAGGFPDPRPGASSSIAGDPGLTQAAAVVRTLTDRGFRVVLRVAPAPGGGVAPAAALTAAVGRLATAFRGTGGLVGYELTATEAARAPGAAAAVVTADPFHLLWRERPAPFDRTATVAVNDPAGYLTGWAGTGDGAVAAFTAAADGNQIGWLYPAGAGGSPGAAAFPAALARPYPIAVAGDLSEFGVDGAGTFTLRYDTTLPVGKPAPDGLLTAVSLPATAYPTGYQVQVTGAKVLSRAGSALLCLAAEPGATAVSLTVTRAPSGQAPAPPPAASAAACPAVAAAPTTGTPAAAPSGGGGEAKSASYDGPLLWALPLLGAVGMGALLGVPFLKLRRLRAGSRTRVAAGHGDANDSHAAVGDGYVDDTYADDGHAVTSAGHGAAGRAVPDHGAATYGTDADGPGAPISDTYVSDTHGPGVPGSGAPGGDALDQLYPNTAYAGHGGDPARAGQEIAGTVEDSPSKPPDAPGGRHRATRR